MIWRHRIAMATEDGASGSGGSSSAGSQTPTPESGTSPNGNSSESLAGENARLRAELDAANRKSASFEDRFKALEGRLDQSDNLSAQLKAEQEKNAAMSKRVEAIEAEEKKARDDLLGKLPQDRQKALEPVLSKLSTTEAIAFLKTEQPKLSDDDDEGEPPAPPQSGTTDPGAPPLPKRYKPKYKAHIEDATGREVTMLDEMVVEKQSDGTRNFQMNRRAWRDLLKGKKEAGVPLTKENAGRREGFKRF